MSIAFWVQILDNVNTGVYCTWWAFPTNISPCIPLLPQWCQYCLNEVREGAISKKQGHLCGAMLWLKSVSYTIGSYLPAFLWCERVHRVFLFSVPAFCVAQLYFRNIFIFLDEVSLLVVRDCQPLVWLPYLHEHIFFDGGVSGCKWRDVMQNTTTLGAAGGGRSIIPLLHCRKA